jgi:AraC family transcriptional regulator of adaptative response/methylated-DNA-[protein]-cysteine methyltransferase
MMTTENLLEQCDDYRRIEKAIRFLEGRFRSQPNLDEMAASVHLSKYHFQRLFKRWAGVSPSQFLQYLTIEYAKERLKDAQSVLDTTLDAGLSSPSRLHDLFVTFEAMTPGEYKKKGEGMEVRYGFHPTPFGECLVALTQRGICALRFTSPVPREETLAQLRGEWPHADFVKLPTATQPVVNRIFSVRETDQPRALHLLLKGTNFQIQVWRGLLAIPPGAMVTYQDLAGYVATRAATRAVGSALAKNPIGYVIPCHRVISKVGEAHRYRWGATRKRAIIGWEASRYQAQA